MMRFTNMYSLIKSMLVILLISFATTSVAEGIPRDFVGVWMTKGSEFDGDQLIGGTAIYISESGRGAFVGAPLPVHRCDDGRICNPIVGFKVEITMEGPNSLSFSSYEGKQNISMDATLDAYRGVLVVLIKSDKPENLTFIHKSWELPERFRNL